VMTVEYAAERDAFRLAQPRSCFPPAASMVRVASESSG
jgi:hypothetical protein